MTAFVDIVTANVDVGAIALLVIFAFLFVLQTSRIKSGIRVGLRPLPAYDRIRVLVSQAIESGRPIHVGLGSGEIGGEGAAESFAALTLYDFVARRAVASGQPVLGTVGSGPMLAAAQGILHRARDEAGLCQPLSGSALQFYGTDPQAYACGASTVLERQSYLASVLSGDLPTGLWVAESVADRNMVQLGATAEPTAAALLRIAVDDSVVGEELYAAGAYLHRPDHVGSLAAQDLMRIILVLSMITGSLVTYLGYGG